MYILIQDKLIAYKVGVESRQNMTQHNLSFH